MKKYRVVIFLCFLLLLLLFSREILAVLDYFYPGLLKPAQPAVDSQPPDTEYRRSRFQLDKLDSQPTPTLTPSQVKTVPDNNGAGTVNYLLEPCDNGIEDCYNMLNVPSEPMSTVGELNAAVNQYRKTHNLSELFLDPQLCELASRRAPELEADFSHNGFSYHVENGDYDYTGFSVIGENIWMGEMSGVHIVEYGWDRSEGHRENLQGDWSRGCAGIYKAYATFIFVR